MSALTAPGLVVVGLLALAGAQKALDPSMTVGALQALRLPSSPLLVRAGATAELALAIGAVAWGGPLLWSLVAASYLVFTVVVVLALRHGTMIGSCGCFGREDTPPHWLHAVLNVVLAGGAGVLAVVDHRDLLDELVGNLPVSALVLALATVALYLLHAAYVALPRTLVAARANR